MKKADWFGELPSSWQVARLCDHVSVLNGYPFDSELFHPSEGMPLVRIRDIGSRTTELRYAGDPVPEAVIKHGDILIGMDGDFSVERWRGEDALLNQRVCCVRPRESLDVGFCFYVLPLPLKIINDVTYSTTVKHLSSYDVLKICFPFPTLHRQRAIATYLDREIERLDSLVAAKERWLAVLAEKRRTLITSAVTRGLNPQASVRDSGLPCLGQIPKHWTAERLKFHLKRIEQGTCPKSDLFPAELEEWGVLKVGAVNAWEFNPAENKRLAPEEEPLAQYEIKEGDLLISRANTTELLGSAVLVRQVRPRLLLPDKIYRPVVNGDRLDPDFLICFLRSSAGRYEFERDATGASNSMQNISQDSVRNVWIPIPPLYEQRAIAAYIAAEITKLDGLQAATERTIDLLKERRAALIASAVTGKMDISEFTV